MSSVESPFELVPLVPMDVTTRIVAVRAALVSHDIEHLVVTKPVNVRWLTGFTGSNGVLLVGHDHLSLVTDARYTEQAARELESSGVTAHVVITPTGPIEHVASTVAGSRRLGLEAAHVTWDRQRGFAEAITEVELVAIEELIEKLRRQKDPGERSRLERAAAIADRSLLDTLPLLSQHPSERRFAVELDHRMRSLGADDVSFPTIVASGPNSALPHHRPSDRTISPGDLVVIDFGAQVDGYGSDMTRTVVSGGNPSDEQQRLYDVVARAQAAGVAAVRAGVEQRSIDQACRDVLAAEGLADAFVHGTGHGLGLEIHEQPILSPRSVGILPAGLIVTVEPGAYLTGFGGVRVEDTVVVTESGCEPITHCPKGLDPVAHGTRPDPQ